MRRLVSRRGVLNLGVAGLLGARALAAGREVQAAGARIDVGLVGPDSGPEPHTFRRVFDALKLHEHSDGRAVFPEFDGKTLSIQGGDSMNDASKAIANVEELIAYGVQWIVSADVYSSVTKATERKANERKVSCILACSRMKLDQSKPRLFSFQVLPDYQSWLEQLDALFSDLGVVQDNRIFLLMDGDSEGFYRSQFGKLADSDRYGFLNAEAGKKPAAALHQEALDKNGQREPAAVLLMWPSSQLAALAAEALPGVPIFGDATLSDAADLAPELAGIPGPLYLVAVTSRFAARADRQKQFIEAYAKVTDSAADPAALLGGVAAQLIGLAPADGDISKIEISAEQSVGGIAVKFDDSGANVAATIAVFQASDGKLERVR